VIGPGPRVHSMIGLDIGTRAIKAAQVRTVRGSLRLSSWMVLDRLSSGEQFDEAEAVRLGDVLYRCGFQGRVVAVSVPDELTFGGELGLPPRSPGVPVEAIARSELGRAHRRDPNSFELALWDLPSQKRGAEECRALAMGLPHKAAASYVDALERGGLEVAQVTPAATALGRLCELSGASGQWAILDMGWSSAKLVLWLDGRILHRRAMPDEGLRAMCMALSQEINADERAAERIVARLVREGDAPSIPGFGSGGIGEAIRAHAAELAAEVSASFSYVAHRFGDRTVDRLLLLGAGAGVPGIAEHLEKALGVRVEAGQAGAVVPVVDGRPADDADGQILPIAVGLACVGASGGTGAPKAPEVPDLLPEEYRRIRHQRRRIKRWGAVLGATATVMLAGSIGLRAGAGGDDEQMRAALAKIRAESAQRQARIEDWSGELSQVRKALDLARSVGDHPDWSVLLALVADSLGQNTVLESINLDPMGGEAVASVSGPEPIQTPGGYILGLSGYGKSQVDVTRLAIRLERSGLFDRVNLVQTRSAAVGQVEAVFFRFECSLGASAGGSP